uniref:CRAL-TRIO domain-containing protein n=1 Tax=Stomoxys calcitrans TaxID=35570 RepID=A0A1I8PQC0_STOCA|nr:unnamed protein product [Stomoxys calcitrans]
MWPLFDLEKQYAEHPHIEREQVQEILFWTNTQPHLPELTEHEVLLFYHACDHEVEYSKQVIDNYFTFRTNSDEFFGNLDLESPQMKLAQKTVACFPLETWTPEGYCVLIDKFMDTDPTKYDFIAGLKLVFAMQDMWLQGADLIQGFVIIIDVSGVKFGHIARINLLHLKKLVYFLQEALPTRLIGVHFVNPSSVLEKLMALIHLFIKKELKDSFIAHSNLESLHKHIPRHILPQEYGGDQLPANELAENFYQSLTKYRQDIIEYNNKRRVNEKLRPRKTNNGFGRMFKRLWPNG